MATRAIDTADVERRIQFVIQEASQARPWYDQTVVYAMRVATNYYCVGKNGGSRLIYRESRYRSKAAHDLIVADNWEGRLLNEHQEPLKVVWDWICDRKGRVTVAEVERRLRRWPMIVITRDEDLKLPKNEPDPVKRYAGIEVLYRGDDGTWTPRQTHVAAKSGGTAKTGERQPVPAPPS